MMRFNSPRFQRLHAFLRDENGAVTVDFVVLTGAVVALVLALFQVLTQAIFEESAAGIVEDIRTASASNR